MKTKSLLWINLIGFSTSLSLLIASFFICHLWWQSVALSLAINMLCSLIVFNFVNRIFDKEVEQKNKEVLIQQEKNNILRHAQTVEVYLNLYIFEYNQLTIPIDKRTKDHKFQPIDTAHFNKNFSVNDLKDFASADISPTAKIGEKIINGYETTLKLLIDRFEKLLLSSNFNFFGNIRDTIEKILIESLYPNGLEFLTSSISNQSLLVGIIEMIKKYSGNPIEEYEKGTYGGSIFNSVIMLYVHLTKIRELMLSFLKELKDLKEYDLRRDDSN